MKSKSNKIKELKEKNIGKSITRQEKLRGGYI